MILDPDAQTLSADGRDLHLTRTQCRLLKALARRPFGECVPFAALSPALWDEPGPTALPRLQVHVCHIRRRLAVARFPALIESVRSEGFRLLQPIEMRRVSAAPIVIPGQLRDALQTLLLTHPDTAAADRFLVLIEP